jgi:elongator complex protein 1
VPPHIVKANSTYFDNQDDTMAEKQKSKKKLTSQEILEYVCWLVDANFIYEAALLTYDLELAAMTARCTQKVINPSNQGPQIIHSLHLIVEVDPKRSIIQN